MLKRDLPWVVLETDQSRSIDNNNSNYAQKVLEF